MRAASWQCRRFFLLCKDASKWLEPELHRSGASEGSTPDQPSLGQSKLILEPEAKPQTSIDTKPSRSVQSRARALSSVLLPYASFLPPLKASRELNSPTYA